MNVRISVLLVGLFAAAAAAFALWGAPAAYPLDDAYIHFAYADNLAAGRGLVFQSPGETSVGATSLLWVLALAAGARLGLPAVDTARVLGMLAHIATAVMIGLLVAPAARRWAAPWLALAAGGLAALCGPLVWFALSGMETMLFTALGLAALLCYRAGRLGLLGIGLGLLCLTRPEGLGLVLAITLVEALRAKRVPLHLWQTGLWTAALLLPWLLYLFLRTGEFLPGSYYGKQFTQEAAIDYFASQAGWIQSLAQIRPLVFAALTVGYWFLYYWGGAYLPGPGLPVPAPLERDGLAWLAFPVALLWLALTVRGARLLWQRRAEFEAGEGPAWLAFALWLLIHNGAFALLLPAPGTASRYIAVDYLAFAVAVALGLAPLAKSLAARAGAVARVWRPLALGAIVAAALATLAHWRTIYVSSAQQVADVRIAMAEHISDSAPAQAVVAAFDIGVIGYYAPQPMVDLGGLTDNRVLDFAEERQLDEYFCDVQAQYLVAPDSNRAGGGSYYDYLGSLGLNASPDLRLIEVERMGMPVSEWRAGGAATGNSTAAVLLYRVDARCGR